MLAGIQTSNAQQNMYAMAASGTRRKKKAAKVVRKKAPKRRPKRHSRKIKRVHLLKPKHRRKKKRQIKYRKRQHKAFKKRTRRKSKAWYRAETKARHWIEFVESRGSWTADNGACYGRYQLAYGYLHGNYSRANQRRTAERYVHNRYGSWQRAVAFHRVHGWY